MKKVSLIMALCLVLSLFLVACGDDEEEASSSEAAPASSEVAESGAGSEAPASGAAADGSAAAPETQMADTTPAVGSLSGRFTCLDPARYPDDRAPALKLSDKGGYVMYFNTGDGRLGVMTGTYEISGSKLEMEVLYMDIDDFLGQDITYMSFTLDGSNILVYEGAPLGLTRAGDTFVKDGGGAAFGGGLEGEGSVSGQGDKNMYILAPGQVVSGGIPGGVAPPQEEPAVDAGSPDMAAEPSAEEVPAEPASEAAASE